MRYMYPVICLLMLSLACSCSAGVWLGINVLNEAAGIYGIAPTSFAPDSPVDVDNITMVEIRLPILWNGTPGTWNVWGPTYDMNGIDMGWQVDIGLWQDSPACSYIRWTAPADTSLPLPQDLTYHYFWFQVPSYLKGEGRAEVFAADSNGKINSDLTCGVPIYVAEAAVPEPSSILALLCGIGSIGVCVWRKKN